MIKYNWLGGIIIDKLRTKYIIGFAEKLGGESNILDLGCGKKPYRGYFCKKTRFYIGLDWFNRKESIVDIDVISDAHQVPFRDGYFDVVICTELLEHTKDPMKVLFEINRVLKKNGMLFISTPFMIPIHEPPNDYYRFTKYGLLYLFSNAKFDAISIKSCGDLFGTTITFFVKIQLKFWSYFAKAAKIKSLDSIYNPFIFLGVYLPQHFYLTVIHRFVKKNGLDYSALGYCAILKKQ
jgi:SAM-dependent methyltransferase